MARGRPGRNLRYALLAIVISMLLWSIAHGGSSVERGYDVPLVFEDLPEEVVITDQSGNTLYNGSALDSMGNSEDWLEQKLRYDRHMADVANQLLTDILGPDKARVTVNSSWDHDFEASIVETANPEAKVVLSETTSST